MIVHFTIPLSRRSIPRSTKGTSSIVNLQDTTLSITHRKTRSFTSIRIMRMEFPTLVDNIIFVSSRISNKVSILIGRIIHTKSTILEFRVNFIQKLQGILLSGSPVSIKCRKFIIGKRPIIFGTKIHIIGLSKVIIGHARVGIRIKTLCICVQPNGIHSTCIWHDPCIEILALIVIPNLFTIIIGHVGKTSKSDNIFIIVNGP